VQALRAPPVQQQLQARELLQPVVLQERVPRP
jgi:hypothetical protein